MTLKVTGLDKLTGGAINGFNGSLTVRISGIGGKRGFTFKVLIANAPSIEAAKVRALQDTEKFAISLLSEVRAELARLTR